MQARPFAKKTSDNFAVNNVRPMLRGPI